MSGRPYDAIYDTTYVASSARDHYRQQMVAGGFMVERAPEYSNMFSKLPQYPSTTFRLKNSDRVPPFVDRTFHPDVRDPAQLTAVSRPEVVAGADRFKYFRRPLLSMPAHTMVKEATVLPPPPPPMPAPEPKAKTVGTQSDYRESEAQTTPWEPMAVLPEHVTAKQQHLMDKYNCVEQPELAYLRDLKFGDGLPPGMHEVWRIEKLRAKRAFEATLPPLDDVEQLPRRQRMIEEWETEEWKEREGEIHGVHNERLDLLEQALLVREEEMDEATMQQVEARKAAILEQKSSKFAEIQASRIKTMRQLVGARKFVEKPRRLHKQTIVERYANFGSTAYAPVQREGRFPEAKPRGQTIETEGYQPVSLPGVVELENYLPARLLNPKVADLTKPTKMDYKQRQEAAIQRDLKAINDLLDTAKSTKGRGVGECWPAPLKSSDLGLTMLPGGRAAAAAATLRAAHQAKTAPKAKTGVRGTTDRPEATELPPPAQHSEEGSRHAAAILLQRLLRGRAVQNVLFEGKARRLELIQELRLAGSPEACATRPEDVPGIVHELDAMLGTVISGVAAAMSLDDPQTRAAAIAAVLDPQNQQLPPDFDADAACAAADQHLRSVGRSLSEPQKQGAQWLQHMEEARRGEVPPPAQVAAEETAAVAAAERGTRGEVDDTSRNFELLMREMAGLAASVRGPAPAAPAAGPAPPPLESEEERRAGREARAAAAAAAEARIRAAEEHQAQVERQRKEAAEREAKEVEARVAGEAEEAERRARVRAGGVPEEGEERGDGAQQKEGGEVQEQQEGGGGVGDGEGEQQQQQQQQHEEEEQAEQGPPEEGGAEVEGQPAESEGAGAAVHQEGGEPAEEQPAALPEEQQVESPPAAPSAEEQPAGEEPLAAPPAEEQQPAAPSAEEQPAGKEPPADAPAEEQPAAPSAEEQPAGEPTSAAAPADEQQAAEEQPGSSAKEQQHAGDEHAPPAGEQQPEQEPPSVADERGQEEAGARDSTQREGEESQLQHKSGQGEQEGLQESPQEGARDAEGGAETAEGGAAGRGEEGEEPRGEGDDAGDEAGGEGAAQRQQSEGLAGEPSFGGQVGGGSQQGRGSERGEVSGEDGGEGEGFTLEPHAQPRRSTGEELGPEPSLGDTLHAGARASEGGGRVEGGDEQEGAEQVQLEPHPAGEQAQGESQGREEGGEQ